MMRNHDFPPCRDPRRGVGGNAAMAALTVAALLTRVAAAANGDPASAASASLTLNEVVELAVHENPELRSLQARRDAMMERPAQAQALPNPMFKYGGMDTVSGGHFPDTGEKRFMVEQEFPGFGKRGLREEMARQDAAVMQRETETMTRDVILMVKEAYFDLYALQRVLSLTRDEENVLKRMEKVAEARYAAGEGSQPDVLKAQSEITLLRQKRLEQEAQETTLKAKLNTLTNRRADAPVGRAVTPPADEAPAEAGALLALAEDTRPELKGARAEIDRYQAERRLMARERLPDYRLGLEYRDFTDSDDMVMFTVGLDLPLWRDKYRAGEAEAARMAVSSQAALEAVRRQVANDVWTARFKLVTARRTLDLYRTALVPQAESRFQASEAAYRVGKVDFVDLLESERFLLNVRVMAAMAEGELGAQAARLERAVGTELKPGAGEAAGAVHKGLRP
jgi:outer membrane protein, heavy metal efflux system